MCKEHFGVGHQRETLENIALNEQIWDFHIHQRMEDEEQKNEEKVFDVIYNEKRYEGST